MTREEKKTWMAVWAADNGLALNLKGECGFGRECVGVVTDGVYPDYHWYNQETWDRIDNNEEVWVPEDAYHKCPCVAVLGRGEETEDQLYNWLKWFDDNNFKLETGAIPGVTDPIVVMLGSHKYARMVKTQPT